MQTSAGIYDRMDTLVQAQLNGTGRSSTQYLHDGQWHHVVHGGRTK